MPVSQIRNSEAQLLGSVDHLFYDDRNFCAEWYDHSGAQTFTLGNALQTLNLDTQKTLLTADAFTIASSTITVLAAGPYLINFQLMSIQNGSSNACVNRVLLEQDPATGTFTTCLPAVGYFPHVPLSNTISSCLVSIVVLAGANYKYRVRFDQQFGSAPCKLVPDGSYFSIVRLFKN